MDVIAKRVEQPEWYRWLLQDVKDLEYGGIVATKHAIGQRIIQDELKFGKAKYGSKKLEGLAQDLDIDRSDLFRCIQFAKQIPKLSTVVDFSWRHIRTQLLPDSPHVAQSTGENEWYTPIAYIDSARAVMGTIDVDPATTAKQNEEIKATVFYTKENSGLGQPWRGNVWMNPPYSQPLVSEFCNSFGQKYDTGEIVQGCVLINNITDTAVGQRLLCTCSVVCFPDKRIPFIDKQGKSSGAPLQGQMIIYCGDRDQSFLNEFSQFGVCLCAAK